MVMVDMTGMIGMAGTAAGSGGGVDILAVLLRIAVLLPTAVVAGLGVTRPAVRSVSRPTVIVAWLAAAIAVAADLFSIPAIGASVPFVVAQVLLTVAVPVSARWRQSIGVTAGLALAVLLVAEYSSVGSGWAFAVDVVYLVAVFGWLGLAALSLAKAPNWRAPDDRLRLTAGIAAGALVVAAVGQVLLSGLAFDRRLYQSGYGLDLLAAVVLAVLVAGVTAGMLRGRGHRDNSAPHAYRFGALGVLLSVLVGGALVAIPKPGPLPVPGTPVLARVSLVGTDVPVLVTPGRPGPNLVHFPSGVGAGLTVAVGSGPTATAVARVGAEGTWVQVNLPAGHDQLVVRRGTAQGSVAVDTGTATGPAATGPAAATGPDGPECASAALGGLVAGQQAPLASCPSETLDPADARALGQLIDYLRSRGASGIVLAGDDSPRSVRAAEAVRQAAGADHLPITSVPSASDALVVVSGWSAAATRLATVMDLQASSVSYGYGVYLAPWLLNPPIVRSVASSLLPLRFDPRVSASLSYAVAVANAFGGENATPDGYYRWLAAQGQPVPAGGVQVYATAQVDAMPMAGSDMADMSQPYPGQWIPGGTIVPVSGVLNQ